MNKGGSTDAYFNSSQDSLATGLKPNVQYCDSETCVAGVRSGRLTAFVSDEPALMYYSHQQPCDLAVVGDPFGPGKGVGGRRGVGCVGLGW